jgi:hypothetical protein
MAGGFVLNLRVQNYSRKKNTHSYFSSKTFHTENEYKGKNIEDEGTELKGI